MNERGVIIQLAGKFAGILSSITVLIVGSTVLLRSMSLDFDSVLYACKMSIAGGLVAGFLGYYIGKTFTKSTPKQKPGKKSRKHPDLLIDDILDEGIEGVDLEEESAQ